MAVIYKRIYSKLNKLTNGLEQFMQGNGYLKLKSTGFMDLVIERISPEEISLAHYYEQNGDLCQDPEVTLRIYPESQMAEALTFQNHIYFQRVYLDDNRVNVKLKKSLNSFANQWLSVLKQQGFYR